MRSDFYMHIPLPPNYVVREDLLLAVRELIMTSSAPFGSASEITPQSTVLRGMGGIGKSVVARALCDDPAIQNRFSDGILWTTLGQKPDLAARMREWIEVLGGTTSENA